MSTNSGGGPFWGQPLCVGTGWGARLREDGWPGAEEGPRGAREHALPASLWVTRLPQPCPLGGRGRLQCVGRRRRDCQNFGKRSSHLPIGTFPAGTEVYSRMDGRIHSLTTGHYVRLYTRIYRIKGIPCKELKSQELGLLLRRPGHVASDSRVDTQQWCRRGSAAVPAGPGLAVRPSGVSPSSLPSMRVLRWRCGSIHGRPVPRHGSPCPLPFSFVVRLLCGEKQHPQLGGCGGPGLWAGASGPKLAPPVSNGTRSYPPHACLLQQGRGKDQVCLHSLSPATFIPPRLHFEVKPREVGASCPTSDCSAAALTVVWLLISAWKSALAQVTVT